MANDCLINKDEGISGADLKSPRAWLIRETLGIFANSGEISICSVNICPNNQIHRLVCKPMSSEEPLA